MVYLWNNKEWEIDALKSEIAREEARLSYLKDKLKRLEAPLAQR